MLDQKDLDASKFSFAGREGTTQKPPALTCVCGGAAELSWEEWSLEPGTPEEDEGRLQGTVTFRVSVKALPPL